MSAPEEVGATKLAVPPAPGQRRIADDAPPAVAPRKRLSFGQRLRRDKVVLLFALPGMLVLFVFQYYALLGNVMLWGTVSTMFFRTR